MKKIIASLFMFAAVGTQAASLSFTGGSLQALPPTYDLNAVQEQYPGLGTFVNHYTATGLGEGVEVDGPAKVHYTYIGSEAGNTNTSNTSTTMGFFNNKVNVLGDVYSEFDYDGGFLDFSFTTDGASVNTTPGTFVNGLGSSVAGLSMFSHVISSTQMLLAFGDGFGNSDWDDMVILVEVSEVPLPAAVWLFGAGLAGLFGARRRAAKKA